MTLTTISGNGAVRQLSINADTLSMVMHYPTSDRNSKEKISFNDRFLGNPSGAFDTDDWGIDIQTVIGKLTNAGCNLHAMPFIFGDKFIGTVYANPNAFQAVITSEPYTEDGKTELLQAVLLDMEGYGRVETHMPVATLDSFLADVAKVKPNLMKVTPDQAYARFYKPGYSLFDADQVQSLRPNGSTSIDVNLNGAAMMGPGRIDFRVNCGEGNGSLTSIVGTRMAKKWLNLLKKDLHDQNTYHELCWRSQEYAERLGRKFMESFCAAVAAKAPQLVKVPNSKEPNYINPARVAWAYAAEKAVGFNFVKPAYHQHPTDQVVRFENNDDAVDALNTVQNTQTRKPVP